MKVKLNWILFLLGTSFRNLLRSPRRTLISLLAIAAATAGIIVFQSFVDGVKATFRRNVITSDYGHFQIFQKGFRDNDADDPYAYQIHNQEEIKAALAEKVGKVAFMSRRQMFYGLLNFNDRSLGGRGLGIDAAEEKRFLTLNQVHTGKHLADAGENSIFIGFGLARKLRVKVGDLVTVLVTTAKGSINAADLEVVGTFKTGITELDESYYYIHHSVAENLLRVKGAPQLLIGFSQENELPLQPALEELVAKRFPNLEVWHWRKLATFFDNTMGWIEKQAFFFKIIILAIATMSIANVFTMSLLERIGEFGTLRAIGTKRSEIVAMIFTESLVQCALGSILGLCLSVGIISGILREGIVMPPPPLMSVEFLVMPKMPWASVGATLLLVIGVAGGAGILPALRMARINIVEALGRNV